MTKFLPRSWVSGRGAFFTLVLASNSDPGLDLHGEAVQGRVFGPEESCSAYNRWVFVVLFLVIRGSV